MSELHRRENEKTGETEGAHAHRGVTESDVVRNSQQHNVTCTGGVWEGGMGRKEQT